MKLTYINCYRVLVSCALLEFVISLILSPKKSTSFLPTKEAHAATKGVYLKTAIKKDLGISV
jgi:hypothetical protein